MFCDNCGRKLKDGWSICPECGKPVRSQHMGAASRSKILPFEQKWIWMVFIIIIGIGVTISAIFIIRKKEKAIKTDNTHQEKDVGRISTEPLSTVKRDAEQEDLSALDLEVLVGATESEIEEIGLKKGSGEGIYVGLDGNVRVSCYDGNVDMISIQRVETVSPAFHTVRIGMSEEEAKERLERIYPEVEDISGGLQCLDADTNESVTCWLTNDKITRIHYTMLPENQEDQELFQQEQDVNGEYIFPDSDKYYLSEDEVRNKSAEELLIGRNEIFARHGYIFETDELQEHFENTSWYYGSIPGDQFDMDIVFNEFEKKNVELIKNIENEVNNPGSQENKRQTLANATSQTLNFNLTVINNIGTDIYHLYASETDTDDWEEDILDDDILYAGEQFDITFTIDSDSLKWDFAIQDEYEKRAEFYDLSFAGCNVEGATLVLWREGGETHASLY